MKKWPQKWQHRSPASANPRRDVQTLCIRPVDLPVGARMDVLLLHRQAPRVTSHQTASNVKPVFEQSVVSQNLYCRISIGFCPSCRHQRLTQPDLRLPLRFPNDAGRRLFSHSSQRCPEACRRRGRGPRGRLPRVLCLWLTKGILAMT